MPLEYRLHGPPGTGKTWTLATSWVPKAAEKFGPHRVVICSLTRSAAKVIAGRNTGVPKQNIGTLHALCFRALGSPEIAEGNLADWNKREPTMAVSDERESSTDHPFADKAGASRGDDLMAQAQVFRHRMVPVDQWPQQVAYFQERWQAWLDETQRVDFTGLIEECLESTDYAPNKPAVFIVDEAQDCSVLELSLVRKWAERANYVVLAGDGDQAIYEWRGASPKAFTGGDIPTENNYHLTKSHRVPAAVHKAASKWITLCGERYAVEYTPTDRQGSSRMLPNVTSKYPNQIIEYVNESLKAGRSAMIIATCAFVLRPTLRKLRDEGIPFHNPYRTSSPPWNPLRGGADRLRAYLVNSAEFSDEPRLWTLAEMMRWLEILEAKRTPFQRGAKARVREAIKALELERKKDEPIEPWDADRLLGREGYAELQAAFTEGTPLEWFADRCLRSKIGLIEYGLQVTKKRGMKALSEEPQVIVGTIHSVKGGEADDVFVYPDLSVAGMKQWLHPGDGRDGTVRTFYVAMTRAKESVSLLGRSSPRAVGWQPL